MSNKVIPGILEGSWEEIERKIQIISKFSKTIHVDFIDGKFVNNLTFLDPTPFSKYSKDPSTGSGQGLFLEAHLMVLEPINYLKPLANSGFKRFIGHVEKMTDQIEFIALGEILGEVGLALDLQTSIDEIKVPFADLGSVLIMTIKAGFSNQEFQNSALEKVRQLRGKTQIPIEIDGGINDQTILLAKQAGANRYVATSFIGESANPSESYIKLKSLA